MARYSTTDAARRFSAMLDLSEREPVLIERHGRPRAALVSMRRFELYEALLRREMEAMAAAAADSGGKPVEGAGQGARARLRLKSPRDAGRGE